MKCSYTGQFDDQSCQEDVGSKESEKLFRMCPFHNKKREREYDSYVDPQGAFNGLRDY